jgi:BASS family bile acid:Na+ symporter
MSFIAKANLALSVTLVAIATLLSPLLTPALMKLLAGQYVDVDFWKMMLDIIDMVILPIVAGLMLNAIAFGREKVKSVIIEMLIYIFIVVLKNYIFFKTSDATFFNASMAFLKNLGWFIVLPIVGGFILKYYAKGSKNILSSVLAFVSMLGIGIIITIITAAGRESLLEIGALLILACLLHNMLGYFLGYWACRMLGLDEKSCRTISLEVGMQNGGLASGLALQMGKVATVGLAPAVFGPMMNITGSSLATWWRGKSTGEEENNSEQENEDEINDSK